MIKSRKIFINKNNKLRFVWLILIDILGIATLTGGYCYYHFLIPHKLSVNVNYTSSLNTDYFTSKFTNFHNATTTPNNSIGANLLTNGSSSSDSTSSTPISADSKSDSTADGDFSSKFTNKFTDGDVISDDSTYKSKNVNLTITKVQKNGVTYYVEDIYVRYISNFMTALADDTYGVSITDLVLNMAKDNNAIAAVNGDYYGIDSSGAVIRNGRLYRTAADGDVCVLFKDGTMKVYSKNGFNAGAVMKAGAWQAWNFGPNLLNANSKPLSSFNTHISEKNPRTALGYFEPGHYCFVLVDGRQENYSNGMSLTELAKLMKSLGCKVAYNLDGGQSSTMTFKDKIANKPYDNGRAVSDILYITN